MPHDSLHQLRVGVTRTLCCQCERAATRERTLDFDALELRLAIWAQPEVDACVVTATCKHKDLARPVRHARSECTRELRRPRCTAFVNLYQGQTLERVVAQ